MSAHLRAGQEAALSAQPLARAAWNTLRREEMVPRRPTSHGGKRPAHRNPGGSQCTALARSARLLRRVMSSDWIRASTAPHVLWDRWLWVKEESFRAGPGVPVLARTGREGSDHRPCL